MFADEQGFHFLTVSKDKERMGTVHIGEEVHVFAHRKPWSTLADVQTSEGVEIEQVGHCLRSFGSTVCGGGGDACPLSKTPMVAGERRERKGTACGRSLDWSRLCARLATTMVAARVTD